MKVTITIPDRAALRKAATALERLAGGDNALDSVTRSDLSDTASTLTELTEVAAVGGGAVRKVTVEFDG